MGEKEISAFLTHLAVQGKVSASTQNQALCSLIYLYGEIPEQDLDRFHQNVVWAKRPAKLPVVLTREEVQAMPTRMGGTCRLMASLFHGSGPRLMECLGLRAKDPDFGYKQLIVRGWQGRERSRDRIARHRHGALEAPPCEGEADPRPGPAGRICQRVFAVRP
jgi:integrase